MTKNEMIKMISNKSDKHGNYLMEFMDKFKLTCLADASEKQLEKFIKDKGWVKQKVYHSRDEFLNDDGFTDDEKIEIAEMTFEEMERSY